jgi:hypothetical protein
MALESLHTTYLHEKETFNRKALLVLGNQLYGCNFSSAYSLYYNLSAKSKQQRNLQKILCI